MRGHHPLSRGGAGQGPVRTTSPEGAVLLACALVDRDRAGRILAAHLPAVRDWDGLRGAAVLHGVAPLLYRLVHRSAADAIPPGELEALHALSVANERRNLRLSGRLLRVLDVLRTAGIEALPVKGPVMAEAIYGDVGLRQFADLDIAIRPGDVAAARGALVAQGFRQTTGVGVAVDRLLASEGGVAFESADGELVLDLHWRLGPRFAGASLPAEELLAEARPARFLGHDVLALSARDLFVVLCVHGSHNHRWDRLELVAALGACGAALQDEQWLDLLERAGRLGCRRRCAIGCLLMREVAGRDLPSAAAARLDRERLALRLASAARGGMFADGLDPPVREGLGGIVWESLALDHPAQMPAHFAARVLTPGIHDWGDGEGPAGWPAKYYLTRPVRLASRLLRRGDTG